MVRVFSQSESISLITSRNGTYTLQNLCSTTSRRHCGYSLPFRPQAGQSTVMAPRPTICGLFRTGTFIFSIDRNVHNYPWPSTMSHGDEYNTQRVSWVDIQALTRLYPCTGSISASNPDWAVNCPLSSLIRGKLAIPTRQPVDDLFPLQHEKSPGCLFQVVGP